MFCLYFECTSERHYSLFLCLVFSSFFFLFFFGFVIISAYIRRITAKNFLDGDCKETKDSQLFYYVRIAHTCAMCIVCNCSGTADVLANEKKN